MLFVFLLLVTIFSSDLTSTREELSVSLLTHSTLVRIFRLWFSKQAEIRLERRNLHGDRRKEERRDRRYPEWCRGLNGRKLRYP